MSATPPTTLITGGAGFIGTNLAHRLLAAGERVRLFDNLGRPGVECNLRWLRDRHGNSLDVAIADVRDADAVRQAAAGVRRVLHFAAQVAVTTSLTDPVEDFDVNARGTLNVLEAIRAQPVPPSLLFTSTNKVYGALEDVSLQRRNRRYEPADPAIRDHGIDERRPLDFHSPYGCSKGTADQYVIDYARSFGIPTIVFRMSCIYGPHQCGTEDQGWVAHFVLRALGREPITLYGDGRQVRDLLFVDDLIDAMLLAQERVSTDAGQAFNIGGGPRNVASLLEVLELIGDAIGDTPAVTTDAWRLGDQRYYVSNIDKFTRLTGWRPKVDVREGVRRLAQWLGPAAARAPESALAPPRRAAGTR